MLPIRPATPDDAGVLTKSVRPMNRFAGRPVPPNRYTAAGTAS